MGSDKWLLVMLVILIVIVAAVVLRRRAKAKDTSSYVRSLDGAENLEPEPPVQTKAFEHREGWSGEKTCSKCGLPLPMEASFCLKCGERVSDQSSSQTPPPDVVQRLAPLSSESPVRPEAESPGRQGWWKSRSTMQKVGIAVGGLVIVVAAMAGILASTLRESTDAGDEQAYLLRMRIIATQMETEMETMQVNAGTFASDPMSSSARLLDTCDTINDLSSQVQGLEVPSKFSEAHELSLEAFAHFDAMADHFRDGITTMDAGEVRIALDELSEGNRALAVATAALKAATSKK